MPFKIYLDEDRFIEYNNEGSILECLEKNNINSDYSCRGGFCGVCAINKKYGEIYYDQEAIFEVKNDTILTCCALPSSDITLDMRQSSFH